MNTSLARVRVLAAGGLLTFSLALLPALPAAAERSSNGGQLLVWLLAFQMRRDDGPTRKINVNSATAQQLRALPGIDHRQALRIIQNRPYAKLPELLRAGVSAGLTERLAAFLTVDPG